MGIFHFPGAFHVVALFYSFACCSYAPLLDREVTAVLRECETRGTGLCSKS